MAQITGTINEKVFSITRWLGLNQNPDGDTKLKFGEAATMRNFRVTRDGNLQKRPGTRKILTLASGKPVDAVWTGSVAGVERVMALGDGKLWSCWDADEESWSAEEIGPVGECDSPSMFGFGDKLWILTGNDYLSWDGVCLESVDGYVPLVGISILPNGGGDTLEEINKLTGKRRAWYSPDGTATVFQLPEKNICRLNWVRSTKDESPIEYATVDKEAGTVTFATAPAEGTNSIEIGWSMNENFRDEITAMHYAETYNGTQDTRVFLYGDGSNTALYSDIDHDGVARADYFPDQNEMRIGVDNTPITAMIRHFSRLLCFKSDSTYTVQFGNIMLANGQMTAAFYSTPVNKAIGNAAPGQVQLVLNSPITLHGADLYEWKNAGGRSANLTIDERQAKRISDRINETLREFDLASCITFDDNYNQEYYVCSPDGMALCWNYAADAWYLYTNLPMLSPFSFRGEVYFGTSGGNILHMSSDYAYDWVNDVRAPISCYWESGSMSFGADYQRKYSARIWLGMKPESKASVYVSVQTDRGSGSAEKVVSQHLFSFRHMNFAEFTFRTNRKPQMKLLKIKAKKFVFYKLILQSETNDTTAIVTSADIRVRYTGYAK